MAFYDGIFGSHPGSWMGLPDFGITEGAGKLLGQPQTNQGGSNLSSLWGNYGGTNPSSGGGGSWSGGGQVAGSATYNPHAGMNQDSNGGWVQQDVNAGGGGGGDPYASIRNDISSAWDNYLNTLGQTSGYLGDQRTAQEGIANSQLSQGQGVINQQKASSLKDIANTTKNALTAGNNYLGSMGAGDSSAANQYSFATQQQASKQTGDLNNFVNGQMNQLQSTHDQQINSIAQWFASAQQQLQQQVAQGQLGKGQDLANLSKGILDQAMQATNQIKQNTQNAYNGLLQWAAQNSQGFGQLQQNIANVNSMFQPGKMNLGAGSAGASAPLFGGQGGGTQGQRITGYDANGNPIYG